MKQFFNIMICILVLILIVVNCSENKEEISSNSFPNDQDLKIWVKKILKDYDDPQIKCNKITGIDCPSIGAIRIMGIWCAEDQGIGSNGMNVAVRIIGSAIDSNFRKEFPKYKGLLTISLWDEYGNKAYGSRDWK